MKKSKFLKKSLATLLALMLVVAMIPMSAAAAGEYKPASVKPVIHTGSGEVTGSGQSWNIAFDYSTTTPVIDVELGTATDKVYVIRENGTEAELTPGTGLAVEYKDDTPVPFKFVVTDSTGAQRSAVYTVNWTMAKASSTVTVKSAKLDAVYAGEVDETAKTITFTVPFGYTGSKSVALEFNGANAAVSPFTFAAPGVVGTARAEAVPMKVTVAPEDNSDDINYNVYVVEEPALESISIGGVKGVIVKDAAGLETGAITFTMPSDTAVKDNKLLLTADFTVGSPYTAATLAGDPITDGEEFDFADILNKGAKELVLTSVSSGTVTYQVTMQNVLTDTTLTGVTATIGNKDYEGVVEGENLTIEVPSDASLTSVDLKFTGPKAITVANEAKTPKIDNLPFNGEGIATGTLSKAYVAPVRLLVVAADGTTQKYYTLTITKTEAVDNNPQITAAKLTTNKGKDNEASYTGDVSQSAKTITFTVPYSTKDVDIQDAGTTEYTFGKTTFATLNKTELAAATVKDGAKVSVTSATGDVVTYTVKFVKSGAQTGKSISDFVLTTENTNSNLMPYNNNKNYNVTVSGKEFKVTVPNTTADLYANFKLSDGAKLYSVNGDAVTSVAPNFDGTTGVFTGTAFIYAKDTKYFVADETLAYAIATNDAKAATYTQIKNNFGSHYAEYTFNTTTQASDKARLTSLSADDGKVTASISGTEITLTVPYSYAHKSTSFFFDFKTSEGATFMFNKNVPLYSNGKKSYANDKITTDAGNYPDNMNFTVVMVGDTATLYCNDGQSLVDNRLSVVAEDGTTTKDYTIKEIKVATANTGAEITSLKANNAAATISGKTINVTLPYGTNLGQVKLAIEASKMAEVKIGTDDYNADNNYDLTSDLKITVTSEDGKTKNVYTLKATVAEQFKDVKEGTWYYDYVMAAAKAGIVGGKGNGIFDPEGNVTRRDFALMLTRMLGVDVSSYTNTPFEDVKAGDYGLEAIAYCAENGIVGGDGKGNFLPDSSITREEAAKMIAVAKELDGTTTEKFNDDAKISSWAKAYVDACKAAGVFGGDEKGNFNPKSPITRAETAKIMVVAMDK